MYADGISHTQACQPFAVVSNGNKNLLVIRVKDECRFTIGVGY